jgi:hypothetical protein
MFAINQQFQLSVTNPDNDFDSLSIVVISLMQKAGNTKGGSISAPLTSCLTGLDMSVFEKKISVAIQLIPNQSNRRSMVQ